MRTLTRSGEIYRVEDTPGDDWGFWDQFAAGQWEPATLGALDRLLTPDALYFDIGAWVGPTVLYAARRCRQVVAVEPDVVALEGLRTNLVNNTIDNVAVVPAALAAANGLTFLYSDRGWGSSMSTLLPTSGERVDITTVTFDDLIAAHGEPQVVKMDIEGAEAFILDHVADRCVAIGAALIVSLHGPYWPPGWAPNLAVFSRLEVLEVAGGFSVVVGQP